MSFDIAKGLAKAKSKKKRRSRKSVYEKQREEETIRNAMQRGYLRRMTMEFLNDNIGESGCDLSKIGYLNVTNSQLTNLGVLEMCVNLRICILPGNYITEFDALENCVNLSVMDLHGNQIKKIPEEKFWVALKKLQILLLHDNGISKLDTIHHLSSSPSLLILTLYDTPLSLKKNYRHHVVNGVWCLKALDHHVISDEEIIEGTKMEGKFAAMQNNFRIDLDHGLTREFTYEEAVKHIRQFIARINKIQAKFSPVLMIQKRFRGYCARKNYKFMMAKRIWAATTIQRFYRFAKGITKSRHNLLPPPSSPLPPTYHSTSYLDHEHGGPGNDDTPGWDGMQTRRASAIKSSNITRINSIRMPTGHLQPDHEVDSSLSRETPAWTPEKLPRGLPGDSRVDSRETPPWNPERFPRGLTCSLNFPASSLGTDCRNSREPEDWMSSEVAGEDSFHGHESSYDDEEEKRKKIKRRMTVDLVKLESTALEVIQSATFAMNINSGLGLESKMNTLSKRERKPSKDSKTGISANGKQSNDWSAVPEKKEEPEDIEDLYKRRMKPEMIGKYRTVRVFLGPILQAKSVPEVVEDDDDKETTGFRLLGVTPPRQKAEPVVEMLLSKKEVGENMRSALRHQKQESRKRAKQVVARSRGLSNDQRLFLRTHGTMSLACLTAVHRAYGDRERAREKAQRAEHVAEMKEKREQVAGTLRAMRQDYRESVVRNRIHEGVQIADALRENEKKQEEGYGKVSTRRAAAVLRERERKAETKFEKAFVSQQSSVSQALRAHDRAELKRERLAKVVEAARREREATLKQQALVKKFMEHRQLVRQTETANARAELDEKMLREASRRFAEMETRTRQTKNRLAQVKEFYPLPPLNAPATDMPLAILSPCNYSPWEAALQRDSRQCLSNSESCSQNQLEPLIL